MSDPLLNPSTAKPKMSTPQDPRALDVQPKQPSVQVQKDGWLGVKGLPID
jgi:hypothetical protein